METTLFKVAVTIVAWVLMLALGSVLTGLLTGVVVRLFMLGYRMAV